MLQFKVKSVWIISKSKLQIDYSYLEFNPMPTPPKIKKLMKPGKAYG